MEPRAADSCGRWDTGGMRIRAKLALGLLGGLTLVACTSVDDALRVPRTPTFQLVELDLRPPRGQAAETVTTIRVDNPNAWPIVVESVEYELVVNGTWLGRTSLGTDLRVPARGNRTLALTLLHPEGTHLRALRERSPQRGLAYRLTGTAKVIGTGVDLVPFRLEGHRQPN